MKNSAGIAHLGRPVTLLETGAFVLLLHVGLFFLPFGLAGMLLAELPDPIDEPELRLTFAPEVDTRTPDESAAAGSVPAAPPPAARPSETLPQTPPLDSVPPLPMTPPLPIEQPSEGRQQPEPPPDGSEIDAQAQPDPVEQPTESDLPDADEAVEGDSSETFDDALERSEDSFVAESDDGSFSTQREPSARAPAASPGQPQGPSLQQRLSDYGSQVERIRAAATPNQQPRNSFEPDWGSLPTTGQAIGNLTFESGDYDWLDYSRQIYFIIWRAWHNRLYARTDDFEKWGQQSRRVMLDHMNAVRFTIERSGQIVDIVVETESGCEPFDLTSVEGLDEALLPPLPDDFPRDSETVHVYFIGQGPIPEMRRTLQALKRANWF